MNRPILKASARKATRFLALPALALAAMSSLTASAQSQLNEHVAVDGRYLPEVTRTERLRSQLAPVELKFGSQPLRGEFWGPAVDFAPSLMTLPPTVWRAGRPERPGRGYVDLSLGSWLNGRLLAGVRAVDRSDLQLDVRFDGLSTLLYKPEFSLYRRRRLDGTLGADLTKVFADRGTLDASVQYRLGWFNYDLLDLEDPVFPQTDPRQLPASPTQTVNDASLRASWTSDQAASLRWNAGASARFFGYRSLPFSKLSPTRETSIRLTGGVDGDVGLGATASDWGVGASASLNTYGGEVHPSTNGLITLTPAWNIARPFEEGRGHALRWEARIGARLDLSFNHRGPFAEYIFRDDPYQAVSRESPERFGYLHVAHDCSAAISKGKVGAYLRATGGVEQQTLSALADMDPYAAPIMTGSLPAYTPADLRVGFTLTPGRGFSAEIEGRWKTTRSIYAGGLWTVVLNQKRADEGSGLTVMGPYASSYYDLHGFSVRLAAEWKAWRYLEAKAEATWQPQKTHTGWFNGYDRPEWTASIALSSRPWRQLRIDAAWELRAKRNFTMGDGVSLYQLYPPANLSDLSAGVSYEFSPRFALGVRLTNILNRKSELTPGFISEGFGATGGIQFLF